MLEKALSELIGHKPRGMFERPGKIVVKPVSDDIGNGLYFQAGIRQRFLGKIDAQRFDTNYVPDSYK